MYYVKPIEGALEAIRDKSNMSQVELAERAGITKSCICHIEKGRRGATRKTAQKIADALGVPLQSLFLQIETQKNTDSVREKGRAA